MISVGRSGGDFETRSAGISHVLRVELWGVRSWHHVPGPLSRRARRGSQYLREQLYPAWDLFGIRSLGLRGLQDYIQSVMLVRQTRIWGSPLGRPMAAELTSFGVVFGELAAYYRRVGGDFE